MTHWHPNLVTLLRVVLFSFSLAVAGCVTPQPGGSGGEPNPPAEADSDQDTLPDGVDACPEQPEDLDTFEDDDGCPEPDNDEDGILDVDDMCPLLPEDFDSFQDEDGCPDEDNDQDGIPDLEDKCLTEPEDYDGDADEDGCPDANHVLPVDRRVVIKEKIFFSHKDASIPSTATPLLDDIARAIIANPKVIKEVEVQGHIDASETNDYSVSLSNKRAEAVRKYLIDKGVDPKQLTTKGFGETQPLCLPKSEPTKKKRAECKAQNRRVEFHVTTHENY